MSFPPQSSDDLPEELRSRRQLALSDEFCFSCHPGLACFTKCCSDVNVILTPLDVLRLSRRRGLTTKQFLDQHTLIPITKALNLPVVLLRMGEEPEKRCPFLGEQGCTVYEDRPWACRMYPVASAIPPARADLEPKPVFFLMEDDKCEGHREATPWTVESWRTNQGVMAQDELETGFREIVTHPWFIGGRRLNPKQIELFFLACYDLDGFRRFVFESSFLRRFTVEPELIRQLRADDEALLRFGFRWLRFALFGEPTMKLRDSQEAAEVSRRHKKEDVHEQVGQTSR